MKKNRISSIKINAVLSLINTLLTMSYSLITFPYAARILGANNIGKVNYANSIASYFILIAALGINTYAIREGGRCRNKQIEINKFASEIYTINFISVCLSYILLIITIALATPLQEYSILICLQSFAMVNTWFSVNWVNVIFEDYLFTTIRSLIVQIMSIVLLFVFVRNSSDYIIYAGISILSGMIVAIINHAYVRRYCTIKMVRRINIKQHFRPIIVLFSNTIAVSIYLNSDTTMIGWILGDYYVGLYTTSVKIYTTIKTIIAAIYNVAIARMSEYYAHKNLEQFSLLLNKIIKMIITIAIPATIGLIFTAKELIILLSGTEYIKATGSLCILSVAFLSAILGGLLAYCVLIPIKRERTVLTATIISAIENIGLNVFLIPILGINGAALTTLCAETTVFCLLFYSVRDIWYLFNFKQIILLLFKVLLGSIFFIPIKYILNQVEINSIIFVILYSSICIAIYYIIEFLLKNECIIDITRAGITFIKKVKSIRHD